MKRIKFQTVLMHIISAHGRFQFISQQYRDHFSGTRNKHPFVRPNYIAKSLYLPLSRQLFRSLTKVYPEARPPHFSWM